MLKLLSACLFVYWKWRFLTSWILWLAIRIRLVLNTWVCFFTDLLELSRSTKALCEFSGRSEPLVTDVILAMVEMGKITIEVSHIKHSFHIVLFFNVSLILWFIYLEPRLHIEFFLSIGANVQSLTAYGKRQQKITLPACKFLVVVVLLSLFKILKFSSFVIFITFVYSRQFFSSAQVCIGNLIPWKWNQSVKTNIHWNRKKNLCDVPFLQYAAFQFIWQAKSR